MKRNCSRPCCEAPPPRFIGLGLKKSGDRLGGILRVTTSTPAKRDHISTRIDFSDPEPDDIYDENIQIADLNALNATLAVIK